MHIAYIIIIRTFTSGNMLSHLTLFCDAGLFIPANAFQRWKTGIMEQYVIMTNQTSKHFETRRKVCVTRRGPRLNKKCVWFVICIYAYSDICCVIYEKHTRYVHKTTVNTLGTLCKHRYCLHELFTENLHYTIGTTICWDVVKSRIPGWWVFISFPWRKHRQTCFSQNATIFKELIPSDIP